MTPYALPGVGFKNIKKPVFAYLTPTWLHVTLTQSESRQVWSLGASFIAGHRLPYNLAPDMWRNIKDFSPSNHAGNINRPKKAHQTGEADSTRYDIVTDSSS